MTITAIDNLGNVDSLTVVVTVLDLVLPTAIAQDVAFIWTSMEWRALNLQMWTMARITRVVESQAWS